MNEKKRQEAIETIIERDGMSLEEAEALGFLPGESSAFEAEEAFDQMIEEEVQNQIK